MKILSNKKYEHMVKCYNNALDEIKKLQNNIEDLKIENDTLKTTIKIKDKNYEYQENIKKILDKNLKNAKVEICYLKIDLENINGFLEQEKQVSTQLRKERSYLRGLLTKHGIKYKKEERRKENEKNNVCE